MDTRISSPPATGPVWALLFGLVALRGMDLGLASSAPTHHGPGTTFWVGTLAAILGIWGLWHLGAQRLSPTYQRRLATFAGPLLVLSLPTLIGLRGYDPQKQALADTFSLALTLLAAWLCFASQSSGPLSRFTRLTVIITAGIALCEQALGHAIIDVVPRAALQGALLGVVLCKLAQSMGAAGSFELRISAALLALPLLARLLAVGSWTALLGVTVPEAACPYTLTVWGGCALVLCATTFPRGKGPSIFAFGLSAALSIALAFLLYLHYLKRFGNLQAKFDAISLPLLGVHFPYPQWQSTAASSVFAVCVIFAVVLGLRCLGQASSRRQGLALTLWLCAGIGLHRSLDLICLALAVDQLRAAFVGKNQP